MTNEQLYDRALAIAAEAHRGQTDKSGRTYIMHPVRVASRCQTIKAKIVALLHDTIEDTGITAERLAAEGFPADIIDGVLSVTRREGETYEDFVRRAAQNPIGRQVKIADLEDNMDLRRLAELTDEMVERQRKYLRAWHYLQEHA